MKLILAAFATVFSLSAVANNQTTDNIYQIELIIFERNSAINEQDAEAWPKVIQLNYPDNWLRLVSPEEARNTLDANALKGREDFSLSAEFLQSIGDDSQPQTDTPNPNANSQNAGSNGSKADFYRFLPNDQKSLTAERRALDRTGHLRTLFHETWIQPMRSGRDEPSLLLRGGDLYEHHHELEGYIQLSLSRYLHIQTNLWFTQFVPNYGQPSDHWPPLPPFPTNVLTSTEQNVAQAAQFELTGDIDTGFQLGGFNGDGFDIGEPAHRKDNSEELESSAYLIKETVVLNQKRRMRSRELHYLDHPKIGLLIVITPVSKDDEADS